MKDTNGVEVEIGTRVAFNRSGDVVLGRVVKFGREITHHHFVTYKIAPIFVKADDNGKVSRVRRPQSLIVLPAVNKI